MTDYGTFGTIVAIAGSLGSAFAAIKLAFMKRAKWQPPEEAVPAGTAHLAGLFGMLVIALLFVFGAKLGLLGLAIATIVLFVIALICLLASIRTNIRYSYHYPDKSESNRVLGGSILTEEAKNIKKEHNGRKTQLLFEDAQGDKDLVWTRDSQAAVHIRSTLAFIFLIGCGTSSLSAAAMLVVVFTGKPQPSTTLEYNKDQNTFRPKLIFEKFIDRGDGSEYGFWIGYVENASLEEVGLWDRRTKELFLPWGAPGSQAVAPCLTREDMISALKKDAKGNPHSQTKEALEEAAMRVENEPPVPVRRYFRVGGKNVKQSFNSLDIVVMDKRCKEVLHEWPLSLP